MMFAKVRYLTYAYLSIGLSKLLFVELPPTVSVTGIILRDGKILCVDLSYYKGLGLPGGLVTKNEEARAALTREIFEETGLSITQATFLGTASAAFRGISGLPLVYQVETSGEIRASEEGNLLWLAPEAALPRLVYPNNQLAMKRYVMKGDL